MSLNDKNTENENFALLSFAEASASSYPFPWYYLLFSILVGNGNYAISGLDKPNVIADAFLLKWKQLAEAIEGGTFTSIKLVINGQTEPKNYVTASGIVKFDTTGLTISRVSYIAGQLLREYETFCEQELDDGLKICKQNIDATFLKQDRAEKILSEGSLYIPPNQEGV